MGKTIISYNDIHEINQKLDEKQLKFKLHLHDVCGSQSFSLELLSTDTDESSFDEMKKVIRDYFDRKYLKIEFLESKLEFYILQ